VILLDTQIILWYFEGDSRITARRLALMRDSDVFYSPASIYEIGVLVRKGTYHVELRSLLSGIEAAGFREIPSTAAIMVRANSLDFVHQDPWIE
jgi:PIN domain nuclease of toxin-antitoxin system